MRTGDAAPLKRSPATPWIFPLFRPLRAMTHLPIIVDPSHATGHASMVKPMAIAAAAAGADGLMIEVHNDPANALCDGQQSLTPAQFADTMQAVQAVLPFACR